MRKDDSVTLQPSTSPPAAHAACVPLLRLFAERVLVTRTDGLSQHVDERMVPLIAVDFEYAGTRVRASDPSRRVFQASTGELAAIDRDAASETGVRRIIERLGAVDLGCVDSVAPPDGCEADYVVHVDADEHAFCDFTARALAEWRALGWRVEVDPAYPFRVVEEPPPWFASLEPSVERTDWFGLELGIEIDGVRVDLLPVVVDLIERLDGGLEGLATSCRSTWALRVNETHHVTISLEKLRALSRVVSELYQGDHSCVRTFPELRGAPLVALDDVFRIEGMALRWTDRTGLVDRTRARVTPRAQPDLPSGLQATLRPYQSEGVAFLQRLRAEGGGGVLADEMGLGKTLQTIAHIAIEHAQGRLDVPALVVAPTSVASNWAREIARFAPTFRVVVLHGPERHSRWRDVPTAHVVVTTYPVLVRDEERFALQRFHLVALDEAQNVKNARSLARRAVERIKAGHRLCLTGTPVENHLGELWSLFDWLAPGLLGNELGFRRFWRQPIEGLGDAERLAALREVVAPHVLRRLKRDVARELPPKTELAVPVELGGEQRELYEAIRVAAHADVRKAIRSKGLAASTVTILDALTKLRQTCCDPRLIAMDAARPVRESAKFETLMALVREQLAAGHRILVFSQFTSMLALIAEGLEKQGIGYVILTGATRDRQRVVDAFEGGNADVFLISLKAGGTGLNLTSADTVVHYDPWWNPAAQAQATDRAYRIGQKRPVFVHNLYVAGSVEERVLELQQRKKWLANALLGDGGGPTAWNEREIDALFAPLEGARCSRDAA
jgi:superfamily II DNA or RNA helicase